MKDKLECICYGCKHFIPCFPTADDPLASPFCGMGHWDWLGNEEIADDPWKDCPNYKPE
jgi:hypothetical protein